MAAREDRLAEIRAWLAAHGHEQGKKVAGWLLAELERVEAERDRLADRLRNEQKLVDEAKAFCSRWEKKKR